ncbi:MAG: TetR/AcrR family transcriptional regulator [Kofleriaceae bacterium]|nr:TetR/AcrR family transcriptional regulator [Kofleriaceae bacterium]
MTSRREREREEIREQIIDVARRLFVNEGYANVTVRKIADAIDYTPGAIYSYFEDKDAIFHAVHQKGFGELMNRMANVVLEVATKSGTPLDQIRGIGAAYLAFARENPEMYDLMFVAEAPMQNKDMERWPEGARTFDLLRGVVRTAIDGGWIAPGDPDAVAYLLWSAAHGMVTLEYRGRCSMFSDDVRAKLVPGSFDYLLTILAEGGQRRQTSRKDR